MSQPAPDPAPVPPFEAGVLHAELISHLDRRAATVEIRYARYGRAGLPCLVALGGISASRLAGQWWAAQVGPGRALDTRRYQVLGVDYLDQLPLGWSAIAPQDQAAALAAVLDALGIGTVEAVIGASYGGAVALAIAECFPARLRAALVLSMADRPAPMATALRVVQRELLRLGQRQGCEREVVALARALAVTTYRSETEFAQRFEGAPRFEGERWRLPVEDYLQAQGERFAARFDAERYRLLSESLDLHRIDARNLRVPLYLLAVDEDRLVPRADIAALARATGASLACLSSPFGHDAFLKEERAVGAWLTSALADLARRVGAPATRVRGRFARARRRASAPSPGGQGDPAIAADGSEERMRRVALIA